MTKYAYRIESHRVAEPDFPYASETQFLQPSDIVAFARKLQDSDIEKFLVLYLNTRNNLIGITIQPGSLNRAVIWPREVAKTALLIGAASVIFLHNHPSGDCEPSPEDKACTRQHKQALELFDIHILDHVVLGSEGKTFSFAENKIL